MAFLNASLTLLQTGRHACLVRQRRLQGGRPCALAGLQMALEPVSRREFMAALTAGVTAVVVAPVVPSWADGAVSRATRERARGQYGPRVLASQAIIDEIQQATSAGNLDQVAALTANPKNISKRERKELESLNGFGALYAQKNAFMLLKGAVRGDRVREPEMERVVERLYATADDIYRAARAGNKDKVDRMVKNLSLFLNSVITVAEIRPLDAEEVPGQAYSSDFDWRRGRLSMHSEEKAGQKSAAAAPKAAAPMPPAPAPAPAPAPTSIESEAFTP
ncbi:hypothetical protein F1559_005041 [Cyanidiococcus yangmingshanensis]|uniref:Uncharacterized protein n=1 Tax=Cyanidiococcus yangmingshanensis TaxID=2690220 RepID=A0A7J7IR82_9RHOD|nr:hypothetical protein F1559_005041 [Cyanidiococcus yangmingshanensis]